MRGSTYGGLLLEHDGDKQSNIALNGKLNAR